MFINSVIALVFVPPTFVRVAWRGFKGEAPAFDNWNQFLEYFQDNWITPHVEHVLLDGPCTNNNAEGWHSIICKLAGKAHPNIYKLAVELFKTEQTATEVSLMQLAAGDYQYRSEEVQKEKEVQKA